MYANAAKNPAIWGPKKRALLVELWVLIESERKRYVCQKAAVVESCASKASAHMALSREFFSKAMKEQNKANKVMDSIAKLAADIQMLSMTQEAAADIMLHLFEMGVQYGPVWLAGQLVGMWLYCQLPQVPTEEYTVKLLEQLEVPKGSSTSFSLSRNVLQAGYFPNATTNSKAAIPTARAVLSISI